MASLRDLARVTTATTGTGTVTLGSAVNGFLTFAGAGVQDGERLTYAIKDGSNSEIGRGVYTSSGTTLTRATILASTNSGSAISLSGSAQVFITAAAEDFMPQPPQGRLTLTTATPVLTSSVSGATTVYYAPYVGRCVPIYNGSVFQMHDVGGELSQATTDTTKSPAAATTNSNYDLFVWCDAGTFRCTRGPAWSSDTSRGTGAGTTELERIAGIYTNKVAITNGPSANRGTYVGTIRTNGSSQIDWLIGGSASGGSPIFMGVWNAYNRVSLAFTCIDSASSWTYATATWRSSNNSTSNRASQIVGIAEDNISVSVLSIAGPSSGAGLSAAVGVNSTSAKTGISTPSYSAASGQILCVARGEYTGCNLGFNYYQWLEKAFIGVSVTVYGNNGSDNYQSGLTVRATA